MLGFGDRRAHQFDALVRPHMDSLFRLAYHLCGERSDAEDLIQDVLVKLMPKTDELARIDRLRPWLKRVLYRQFVDQYRRQARRPDVSLSVVGNEDEESEDVMDRLASHENSPQEEITQEKLQQNLHRILMELKPDQRTLIVMHDVEGRPQEEISEILDLPVGTVKSRLHRIRAQLRRKVALKLEP